MLKKDLIEYIKIICYMELSVSQQLRMLNKLKMIDNYSVQGQLERAAIQEKLIDSVLLLHSFYDELNLIPSIYRNGDAMSALYYYLTSGRCSSLNGKDGAYYIYEQEFPFFNLRCCESIQYDRIQKLACQELQYKEIINRLIKTYK